ncbi:hypothetical protein BCR37DRAFT_375559 [Protomyces lactucae-debilis]|uniref:CFEM domain-containing protein n=1 Tax=Protomyces lactucae-debilis TaxID=2754530 RepID=A0A1Y2FUL2_PROLT|nr:uncharacterized protein BCR37DRAFT_375559 [Protomyces lactucae-debilis]ORY87682.1 hypothetical protein BCR37DRAFT_375559 [Protomyces lactucae-debilis]
MLSSITTLLLVASVASQAVILPNCAQTCIVNSMILSSCNGNARCLCQDQNYITAVARCIVPVCSQQDQDRAATYVSSTLCSAAFGINNAAQIQQAIGNARVQQGAANQAATAVGNQAVTATTATATSPTARSSAASAPGSGASKTSSLVSGTVRSSVAVTTRASASATATSPVSSGLSLALPSWLLALPALLLVL